MKLFPFYCILLLIMSSAGFGKIHKFDTLANDMKCITFQRDIQKNLILKKVNYDSLTLRPLNQQTYKSPKSMFLIHYDTQGEHAVDLSDKNLNNIPDYVDSIAYYAEYVFDKQVMEMGFISPFGDSLRGGTDAFDIYLFEIGDGATNPDNSSPEDWGGIYGYTVGELPLLPPKKYSRYTSYMVIDNNFSPKDSIRFPEEKPVQAFKTFGITGAKITLAHEFFHAIQFRYGMDEQYSAGFSEMCSVMMENLVFPESRDYLQYVRSFFKKPDLYNFINPSPENGYRFCLYPIMLEKEYGVSIIRNIWEMMSNGNVTYKSIDSSLTLLGSSLEESWKLFLKYLYHTGYRTIDGMSFNHSNEMPVFPFQTTRNYSEPSVIISGDLDPFQIRFDQIIFYNNFPISNDTLKLLTTHLDVDAAVYGITSSELFSQLVCTTYSPDYERIFQNSPINYFYQLKSTYDHIFSHKIEIPGIITKAQSEAYPNPFHTNIDTEFHFPAPENSILGEELELVIYNENLKEVFRKFIKVDVHQSKRVLYVPLESIKNDLISTGIYIYRIENEKYSLFGKIAIIKD